MKHFTCILSFFVINFSFIFSQAIMDANTKSDLNFIKSNYAQSNDELLKFPIKNYNGESCISLLCKSSVDRLNSLKDKGYSIASSSIGVRSLRMPISRLNDLNTLDFKNVYVEIAGKFKPTLDRAIADLRADSVHAGINLPQGYTGKNVYIGVTDWGFDYSSPVFYDTLLNQTRIVAAWDQYKLSGPNPSGFSYGTEYNTPNDLISAGSDTANIYSFATHGTHVASIAGGSGGGTQYRGVAFEANFLFVTFLIDASAVLDAWEWMYQKAQADGKRLVINMSWGLYHFGTLDGTSLLSQAITSYTDLDVLFVNSGGNNGNVNFHLKKVFDNDSIKTKVDFYPYTSHSKMWGQSIHAWGESGNSFDMAIQVASTSVLAESPYYSTANTNTYIDTFLVTSNDTIWYNISADSAHPLNGRPQMRFRVKNTNTSLKVILKSRSNSGTVHYWNVTELSNDVGNWGMPFSFFGSGSVWGDSNNGISEPSCSDDVISIAAYTAQYYTGGGSLAGGAAASFSSNGPRYDGVMKPDVAAPGVAIASAISSYTDNSYTSIASVPFNGRTYHFAKFSGTSMASPMVAGVAALVLQANPYLTAREVKEIIKLTCRQDNFTGSISAAGDPKWGWGKVNAYAAVQLALQYLGSNEILQDYSWKIIPNPSTSLISISDINFLQKPIQIFSIDGELVLESNEASIDIQNLNNGVYWLRICKNGTVEQQKFIKL